jgi:hypothetical protein
MSTNDADLEYGPTPADAQHEHTDIEPTIARKFALWLSIAMLISVAIVYGTFWWFEGHEETAALATQRFPLAAGQIRAPEGPRLQTQPFKDIYLLRQGENEKLTSYAWVDQANGVVRIPIEDALRLMAERGTVASSPQPPSGLNQVVEESSSGRTATTR